MISYRHVFIQKKIESTWKSIWIWLRYLLLLSGHPPAERQRSDGSRCVQHDLTVSLNRYTVTLLYFRAWRHFFFSWNMQTRRNKMKNLFLMISIVGWLASLKMQSSTSQSTLFVIYIALHKLYCGTGYGRNASHILNCHLGGASMLRQIAMVPLSSYCLIIFYISYDR